MFLYYFVSQTFKRFAIRKFNSKLYFQCNSSFAYSIYTIHFLFAVKSADSTNFQLLKYSSYLFLFNFKINSVNEYQLLNKTSSIK